MDFYTVDSGYISYLKKYEKDMRSFTKLPDAEYEHGNIFCGSVFESHDLKYYVFVSAYKHKQDSNILIRFPEDSQPIKGSLRFNFMFPVPDECITRMNINQIENPGYRMFVQKEYDFCNENTARILHKAEKVYLRVISGTDSLLCDNSCDFKILENGCKMYISEYIKS